MDELSVTEVRRTSPGRRKFAGQLMASDRRAVKLAFDVMDFAAHLFELFVIVGRERLITFLLQIMDL
jgi:hypothetical protein